MNCDGTIVLDHVFSYSTLTTKESQFNVRKWKTTVSFFFNSKLINVNNLLGCFRSYINSNKLLMN